MYKLGFELSGDLLLQGRSGDTSSSLLGVGLDTFLVDQQEKTTQKLS